MFYTRHMDKAKTFVVKNYQIIILLVFGTWLRLTELGFSNFYGDETKAIYNNKQFTPIEFLLQQRKGPGQFIVTWFVETISGGYNEFLIRLPFALVGIISIYILYLIVSEMFNKNAAILSSAIFTLNGFYIAFSRTAQYQSMYIFFGLLALYFFLKFFKYQNNYYFYFGSVIISIGLLFHYDSVFFVVPILLLLFFNYSTHKSVAYTAKRILFFALIVFVITLPYYLSYVIYGNFLNDTLPYLANRISAHKARPSNTLYTFLIYNPLFLNLILISFFPFSLLSMGKKYLFTIFMWFLFPFILFEFVFKSAGTHIHNYYLPLIMLSGVGLEAAISRIDNIFKKFLLLLFSAIFILDLVLKSLIFVPMFDLGYPWKDVDIGLKIPKLRQDLQVFVYGFPYNRAWDQISVYLSDENEGVSFYTNDNIDVAVFYMSRFKLQNARETKHYIYVYDNQLGDEILPKRYIDKNAYLPTKDFYHKDKKVSTIYSRVQQ